MCTTGTFKKGVSLPGTGRLVGMGGHLDKVRTFWEWMHRYASGLAEALEGANAFVARAKGDDTGLYRLDARRRRLLPF